MKYTVSEAVRLRNVKAAYCRHGNTAGADDADREMRTALLAEHIRALVDQAPPLTAEQRGRLSALLRPDAA